MNKQEALKLALEALKFYADGSHFHRHNPTAWDTVSGEPQNFYEDEENTATVEDGTLAKSAIDAIAALQPTEQQTPGVMEAPGVSSGGKEQPEDDRARFEAAFELDHARCGMGHAEHGDAAWWGWQAAKRDAAQAPKERAAVTDAVTLECVQAVAYNYFHHDQDGELICNGCSGLYVDGNCNHRSECLVLKARALLSLAQSKEGGK